MCIQPYRHSLKWFEARFDQFEYIHKHTLYGLSNYLTGAPIKIFCIYIFTCIRCVQIDQTNLQTFVRDNIGEVTAFDMINFVGRHPHINARLTSFYLSTSDVLLTSKLIATFILLPNNLGIQANMRTFLQRRLAICRFQIGKSILSIVVINKELLTHVAL